MKKCASCSKDLPEAALHCVFCGAKQAPVPAVQSSVAKTAFGYSANEVMQQLGNQAPQQGGYQPPQQRQHPPSQPPQQQPYQPPQQPYQPPQQPYQPPQRQHPPSSPPGYQQPSGLAPPSAAANAATMMVSPGQAPPPAQSYNPSGGYNQSPQYGGGGYPPAPAPAPGYGAPGYGAPAPYPAPGGGMGIHSPQQQTPQPLPAAPNPYIGAQTGAARGLPVEPWRDSLKLMMLVWGAVALVAFVIPLHVDPTVFNWDAIIHAPGKLKVPSLVWASVALLSIVFALAPMMALPRGALAAVLGLAGIFVPMVIADSFGHWQLLLPLVGSLALVPGLLMRNEYTDAMLPRVFVTVGVICVLLPYVIPDHGHIPLVDIFKAVIEAPGDFKIVAILMLGQIVLAVMCLLAWMPGPATAAGKPLAWAVILYPVVMFAVVLLMAGHVGDIVSKQPGVLFSWAVGGLPGGKEAMIPGGAGVVYSVLVGYGLATVFGKQLE